GPSPTLPAAPRRTGTSPAPPESTMRAPTGPRCGTMPPEGARARGLRTVRRPSAAPKRTHGGSLRRPVVTFQLTLCGSAPRRLRRDVGPDELDRSAARGHPPQATEGVAYQAGRRRRGLRG